MKYALPSKLHGKRLLPLAGLLLASFHASAFDCVESGTNVVDKPPIDIGELAIPANVPDKTKVWESNPITVTAFCDNNTKSNFKDYVTFYFNPKSKSLGQGLKLGVTYEGKDLEQDGQALQVPNGGPVYKKGSGTPTSKTVTVTFRLYIRTDGTPPASGHYQGADEFVVFQLDGSSGINFRPDAKNLKYSLSGLTGARFLSCGAQIKLYPENQNLDFGDIDRTELSSGNVLSKSFTVKAVKEGGCLEDFSLTSQFATTETLLDSTNINLNNGVKLGFLDQDNKAVEFNKYTNFGSMKGITKISKNYTANISMIPGQTIKAGPFVATTIVKVNYY